MVSLCIYMPSYFQQIILVTQHGSHLKVTLQTWYSEHFVFSSFVGRWTHLAAILKSHSFIGTSEASTQHPLIVLQWLSIAMCLSIFSS